MKKSTILAIIFFIVLMALMFFATKSNAQFDIIILSTGIKYDFNSGGN